MTQTEIAARLGVTQSYISKYFKGKLQCSLKVAKKMTELFGQDPLFWMDSPLEKRRSVVGNQVKQNNG